LDSIKLFTATEHFNRFNRKLFLSPPVTFYSTLLCLITNSHTRKVPATQLSGRAKIAVFVLSFTSFYPHKDTTKLTPPGKYDLGTVHQIVNSAMVVHVSFSPAPEDSYPAILPMIAVMGSFDRPSADLDEPLDCYLHGYVSSRIMNLSRSASTPSEATSRSPPEAPKGLPVCIAASKVDGIVLALTPNSHSYNYRSAILFGHALPVTSVEEKLWAMELITNKVVPGRWDGSRVPPNASEMQSTNILRVKIDTGSAKIRAGPPADSSWDLEDENVLDTVWTGFVPLTESLGEPVPSVYNRVAKVPEHVEEARKAFNRAAEEYAEALKGKVAGKKVMYGEI